MASRGCEWRSKFAIGNWRALRAVGRSHEDSDADQKLERPIVGMEANGEHRDW